MSVAQIVNTDTFKAGIGYDEAPGALEVGARLLVGVTCDHELPETWKAIEHVDRRGIEDDGFLTGLGIRQQQQSSLKVHLAPAQVEDFSKAAAGENQ